MFWFAPTIGPARLATPMELETGQAFEEPLARNWEIYVKRDLWLVARHMDTSRQSLSAFSAFGMLFGDQTTYLSARALTFASNVWHLIALTWTSTNTVLVR